MKRNGNKIMTKRKISRVGMVILFAVVITSNIFIAFQNHTITGHLSMEADFSKTSGARVLQVCNAQNVWDISRVPSNTSLFKEQNPTIDTLVLMTATGGRSGGTNEHVFRHPNGTLYYNFTNLTSAIDKIVGAGFELEIVIGNTPHVLANQTTFVEADYGAFDALTLPPGNLTEYSWYIANLTSAMLARYGMVNVSQWEWRLMTEPDNKDWWTASLDDYIDLWMATFGELKKLVPNATLILGNMAWRDELEFASSVLQEVKARNVSLLPDIVSFSYYHALVHPPQMDDLRSLIITWEKMLDSLHLGKNITITCEEGMILVDENGVRLWAGDGTELGAAWEAWMISSVMGTSFTRFVQWSLHSSGYLSPKGFVHLMNERLEDLKLVETQFGYSSIFQANVRSIGGFAAIDDAGTHPALLLYNYNPDRHIHVTTLMQVTLKGLQQGSYNVTTYRIDKHQHNWFTKWLQDSTIIPNPDGASIYDLMVGIRFDSSEDWDYWWNWRQENPAPPRMLLPEEITQISVPASGTVNIEIPLETNSVVLLELDKL